MLIETNLKAEGMKEKQIGADVEMVGPTGGGECAIS